MTRIVNLTPHAVRVNGLELAPSGTVARCAEVTADRGTIRTAAGEVPAVLRSFGAVEGLPAPEPDTLYVVSSLVAQAAWAQGRADVVCPGELIRDDTGAVVGCRNLVVSPLWRPA